MKRLLRAAAVLVLAIVLVPAPALAGTPDPPLEPEWRTLLCTSGAVEHASVKRDAVGFTEIVLTGYLDCARPADSDAYYGFARYGATSAILRVAHLERYATAPPSLFSHTIYTYFLDPAEFGVCLVTDRMTRIGCFRAVYDGNEVTIKPLPTDAPLVARVLRVVSDTGDPRPFCGGCW
jgi:hypothetical protein